MSNFRTHNYVGPVDEQCGGKRRYLSKGIAKQMKRRLRGQKHLATLHPYRCPHCNFWHLGNS